MCKLLLVSLLCLCLNLRVQAHNMDSIPNNGIPWPPVPPELNTLEEDSIAGRIPCPPVPPELTSSEEDTIFGKNLAEIIKERWQQEIGNLNDYISIMADKTKSLDTRNYYKERALKLFIGGGEAFVEDGIYNSGVKIEIASVYRKRPLHRLLKDYFSGLVNLRYSKVDIQPIILDGIEILDYKKIDHSKYEITASILQQSFAGMRDGKQVLGDKTRQNCKIHILEEKTVDGIEYIVLLGNIVALEISNDR